MKSLVLVFPLPAVEKELFVYLKRNSMSMKRVYALLLLAVLTVPMAAQTRIKPYLEAKDLPDATFFLPPPPAEDSPTSSGTAPN